MNRALATSGLIFAASGLCVLAVVDENANSMSDLWEKLHNIGQLYPSSFLPEADADGDGFSNFDESTAGTDPEDGTPPDGFLCASVQHIPAVYFTSPVSGEPETISPESFVITWPTIWGKHYTLLCSPDLSPGSWMPIAASEMGYGYQIARAVAPTYQDGSTAASLFWRVAVTDADTDEDGFTDYDEFQKGTDIWVADMDDDGLPDEWEIVHSLNPDDDGSINPDHGFEGDPDGDGLFNFDEHWYGGDPRDPDTDDDGLDDFSEIWTYGTSISDPDPDSDGLTDYVEILTTLTAPWNPDSDSDGLSDGDEVNLHCTNPLLKDTDGDTLRDDWELRYFFNPLNLTDGPTDPDNDGLPNPVEQLLKLNPRESDSDFNNVPDGNGDHDKDGLTNYAEVHVHFTNPKNPDTDRDGLPDDWEILRILNPNNNTGNNGATGDPDLDSLENFAEWLNNTDPFKADSDGGGVSDNIEVNLGSDPNNPDDDDHPPSADDIISLPFTVSDPSGSHSEKWRMTIRGLDPDDRRSMSLTSPGFGEQATGSMKLLRGMRYEVTVTHLDTDPQHLEENNDQPDYDWECTVGNKPTSRSFEPVGGTPGRNNFFRCR